MKYPSSYRTEDRPGSLLMCRLLFPVGSDESKEGIQSDLGGWPNIKEISVSGLISLADMGSRQLKYILRDRVRIRGCAETSTDMDTFFSSLSSDNKQKINKRLFSLLFFSSSLFSSPFFVWELRADYGRVGGFVAISPVLQKGQQSFFRSNIVAKRIRWTISFPQYSSDRKGFVLFSVATLKQKCYATHLQNWRQKYFKFLVRASRHFLSFYPSFVLSSPNMSCFLLCSVESIPQLSASTSIQRWIQLALLFFMSSCYVVPSPVFSYKVEQLPIEWFVKLLQLFS